MISDLSADDLRASWPVPGPGDDKYSRGVGGVDTGSARYPGAAVLSTLGAVRTGAGFVRFCGAEAARAAVLARCPSVTFGSGRVDAWVVGSGWDEDELNGVRLAARLADGVPCVIDAGALWVMDDALETLGWAALPGGCILTPHAGELARLLGRPRADVAADPAEFARVAAGRFGSAVLVKGSAQFCAQAPGAAAGSTPVRRAVPGPAWSAQAGSGDVLAGAAGALLAALMKRLPGGAVSDPSAGASRDDATGVAAQAGLVAAQAGLMAASLQALTASRHLGPWAPDQLADWFPETVRDLVA